jgi:hypothetical protein
MSLSIRGASRLNPYLLAQQLLKVLGNATLALIAVTGLPDVRRVPLEAHL